MGDNDGALIIALFALLIALQVADLVTTARFIFIAPHAESNPIGRWLFNVHGFAGLTFGKAVVLAIAAVAVLHMFKRRAINTANGALIIANVFYTLIVALTIRNNAEAFGWDLVSLIYLPLLLCSTVLLMYLLITLKGRR